MPAQMTILYTTTPQGIDPEAIRAAEVVPAVNRFASSGLFG